MARKRKREGDEVGGELFRVVRARNWEKERGGDRRLARRCIDQWGETVEEVRGLVGRY